MTGFKKALVEIKDSSPFPMKRMGQFGLRYSVMPKEQTDRLVLFMDSETHAALAVLGLELKMTVDEVIRRAAWVLVSEK